MCLIANVPLTKTIKKYSGKLTVWKAFIVNHKYKNHYNQKGAYLRTRWESASLYARYRSFDYEPDVEYTASDSAINMYNEVHKGLHVCLTEAEAKSLTDMDSAYQVVVKLEVDLADLVAVGRFSDYSKGTHEDEQAVFTKLKIPKAVYDKAIATAVANLRKYAPNYFPKQRKATLKKN